MTLLWLLSATAAVAVVIAILRRLRRVPDTRRLFVRIDDDGSVHELTDDEVEYLETPFEGADGARPYIKTRYDQRTPDGRIGGFLYRSRLTKSRSR